ncbi:hypothetical protein QYS49_28500 [Marivirga salinae]|uniref:Uncharacterized protein n=1 Tax=Marivirga salinarum TaxID=3059078 RepID=A0AA49JBF1_9BACT|nr:hypothetical protein [Marivirga sp. BDSF4-3]WKK75432.2 hypothetical protein QYS49_28500 [Marivirga sp. BDSF4-3]
MPKIAHQYLQLGSENEMFSLVKMREVDAPDILSEFEELNFTRLNNVINVDRLNSETGNIPPLDEQPFKGFSKNEQSQRVSQFIDSLTLVDDELNRPMFVYSGFHVFSRQFLKGAYVKASSLKIFSENGDTHTLAPKWGSESFSPLNLIGPFHSDIFKAQPKIDSCSLDLTFFVATETEEITLTNKRKKRGEFELDLKDSTLTLSYQHDGIRLFSPYPMHSLKCYDKAGNEVQARLVGIEPNGLHKSGRYTALELAEIYANQDLIDPHKTVSFIFEASNVDHVVLEAYTDIVPFKETLSRP